MDEDARVQGSGHTLIGPRGVLETSFGAPGTL